MDSIKVSELLEEMGGLLPEDKIPNIIPVVNRAIMILSKRLYLHESDLVKDDLAVPIAASIDYTASTIAFVSGGDAGPDTITDSAAQFLVEGFAVDMPIYSDISGNTSDVRIAAVTAGTITLREGDKVTEAAAGSPVTLTSRANYGYMPDDFFGFVSHDPNISGERYVLPRIPNREEELRWSVTSASTPRYHKLMNKKIYVFPETSADVVIAGEYYKKATRLTSMDDYLPFSGLFDDVLQDYILAILGGGPVKAQELNGMLLTAVDLVVSKRERKTIDKLPGGTDYEDLHE
jgi:hypothetical protein